MANEQLIELAVSELAAALPSARAATVRRAVVVREKRATFSVAPGQPRRPATQTALPGLLLAGDWIDTGLPATIEGAVRSGHMAADLAVPLHLQHEGRNSRRISSSFVSMSSIVIHYQELALKGKNRPWFIGRLVRNLRHALADLDVIEVRALMGRIEVKLGPATSREQAGERIRRTFGIANFSYARRTPLDINVIAAAILEGSGRRRVPQLSRQCASRGQTLSDDLAPDRT